MEPATDRTLDQIAAKRAAAAGPALPGTLLVRSYACGKRRCRCRADPPALHGPYAEWTRKIGGKTVTRRLTAGQLADWQPLFDNARKNRALVAERQELTLQAIGANDHDNTCQAGHNTVDAAPLTCGQPPGQRPFPQVTAKCEDLTQESAGQTWFGRLQCERAWCSTGASGARRGASTSRGLRFLALAEDGVGVPGPGRRRRRCWSH